MPSTNVETALTALLFLKIDDAISAQERPIAHDVYPLSLMTS